MSWGQLLLYEVKAIFSHKALLLTVFGGVLFYSFLYPLPYKYQLPRDQKIVVVDFDKSGLSRKLIRMVDATPQIDVNRYADSISKAERWIEEDGLAGMLVVPKHFYRDIILGKSPVLSYSGDASYFLVYSTVVKGMVTAGQTLAAGIKINRMLIEGKSLVAAKEQYTSVRLNLRPVFNTVTGYINYVVPAVFVLILHQTLLIATGLLGGTQNEMSRTAKNTYWLHCSPLKLIFARSLIFLSIYLVIMLYYFGTCFSYYDISRLANPIELAQLAVPFLLSTTFLGIFVGQLLPRRELATVLVVLSSLPIVFVAGFVWPVSMLPVPLYWLSRFIPAVPGIQAFLQLNQMGADFIQIKPLWLQLWIQAAGYFLMAWWTVKSKSRFEEKGTV